MAQLSHLYMTTGKTIPLTRWTFVSKVMSLLSNALSSFYTAFLPRSKNILIPWLQSLSTVILETQKIKLVTVSNFSQSIGHEVMGLDAMISSFWMLSFKPTFSLKSAHCQMPYMHYIKTFQICLLLRIYNYFILSHVSAVEAQCSMEFKICH